MHGEAEEERETAEEERSSEWRSRVRGEGERDRHHAREEEGDRELPEAANDDEEHAPDHRRISQMHHAGRGDDSIREARM